MTLTPRRRPRSSPPFATPPPAASGACSSPSPPTRGRTPAPSPMPPFAPTWNRAIPLRRPNGALRPESMAVIRCPSNRPSPPLSTTNRADSPTGLSVDLDLPRTAGTPRPPRGGRSRDLPVRHEGSRGHPARGALDQPRRRLGPPGCSAAQVGLTGAPGATPIRIRHRPGLLPRRRQDRQPPRSTPRCSTTRSPAPSTSPSSRENPFGSLLAMYLVVEGSGRADQAGRRDRPRPRRPAHHHLRPDPPAALLEHPPRALRRPPRRRCAPRPPAAPTPPPPPSPPGRATPRSIPRSSSFQITQGLQRRLRSQARRRHPEPPRRLLLAPSACASPARTAPRSSPASPPPCPRACSASLAGIPYCPDAVLAAISGEPRHRRRPGRQPQPARPPPSSAPSPSAPAPAPTPSTPTGPRLPRRPLQRRPAQPGGHHPGRRRPLRPRHVVVRNALRVDPESTQITAVSDPLPHGPARHPARPARRPGRPRPPRLHPQPDQLRTAGDHFADRPPAPGRPAHSRKPLPGRQLRPARLQAQAQPAAQGRRQARQAPGPDRDPPSQARRRQHRPRPGQPAALGLPRQSHIKHDLHPGAVRRRERARASCPAGSIYGKATRHQPDPRLPADGPRLPALAHPTRCPTWCWPCAAPPPSRSTVEAGRAHRLRQGGGIRTTFAVVPDAPV